MRDIMPLTGFSFLSDTRIKLVILLILALQVTSVIVFYHQHSIIKKELTCRINQEQLYGKQSSLSTEGSDMDISVTSTAAAVGKVTTVGVSTLSPNLLEEIETVRKYSDVLIHYSNWSSQRTIDDCEEPLELPITKLYVRETLTLNCFGYKQCKERLSAKENVFKGFRHRNLQYNLVIAGDGTIFESLSWNCSVKHWRMPDRKSIVLALTGNTEDRVRLRKLDYEVTYKQYAALKLFIMANLINGNLSPSYQLIPHCCIEKGQYPGKWVYTNLTRFENFYGIECLMNGSCKYRY